MMSTGLELMQRDELDLVLDYWKLPWRIWLSSYPMTHEIVFWTKVPVDKIQEKLIWNSSS